MSALPTLAGAAVGAVLPTGSMPSPTPKGEPTAFAGILDSVKNLPTRGPGEAPASSKRIKAGAGQLSSSVNSDGGDPAQDRDASTRDGDSPQGQTTIDIPSLAQSAALAASPIPSPMAVSATPATSRSVVGVDPSPASPAAAHAARPASATSTGDPSGTQAQASPAASASAAGAKSATAAAAVVTGARPEASSDGSATATTSASSPAIPAGSPPPVATASSSAGVVAQAPTGRASQTGAAPTSLPSAAPTSVGRTSPSGGNAAPAPVSAPAGTAEPLTTATGANIAAPQSADRGVSDPSPRSRTTSAPAGVAARLSQAGAGTPSDPIRTASSAVEALGGGGKGDSGPGQGDDPAGKGTDHGNGAPSAGQTGVDPTAAATAPTAAVDPVSTLLAAVATPAQQVVGALQTLVAETRGASSAGQTTPAADTTVSAPSGPMKTLTLQLNPEHLGPVSITLRLQDDAVNVHIAVSTPQALHQLEQDRHVLSAAMAALGDAGGSLHLGANTEGGSSGQAQSQAAFERTPGFSSDAASTGRHASGQGRSNGHSQQSDADDLTAASAPTPRASDGSLYL